MRIIKLIIILCLPAFAWSQPFDTKLFNAMQWRFIGPYRGGRTVGGCGIPTQPNVFYISTNNGGVWKTTDYGHTWVSVFDDQPTQSIGDVAVSPSNPNVVYVASGEGIQRPDLSVGDGVYKSIDAGKTWVNTGLNDGQQIGGLAIDAKNPDRVFAAVLGHPYGPNKERGVYRTLDGGKSWKNVLYIDENTGAIQVVIDPVDPNIVYADLWAGRQGPWENGQFDGPESGLFKSTDGGEHWTKLTNGLPTPAQGLTRIGFCIAPSDHNRLYATVDAGDNGGIYRSDDGGLSWVNANPNPLFWGRGDDFAEVKVDPNNKDIVYTANVVTWKSVDAGKTWTPVRGAPGGDDYHRIWINPIDPKIMLITSDQGAMVTVNGGETFTNWDNQPTAQFYHVSADNDYPYHLYSGQQENGSVGISTRGNDGQITLRDWHPVSADEYSTVAPDPLDPNIIYGGRVTRYDKRTAQVQNISPEAVRSGKFRTLRTAPLMFSPLNPRLLYFGANVLFRTRDEGRSWEQVSPDLSRSTWTIPANVGVYTKEEMKTMPRRGVIYSLALSPLDSNTIWVGTDDGLIHLTKDGGKNWKDVTPPALGPWSKVSIMDPSHFDVNTVYAAVNGIRLDDQRPHIFKTTDGGKSWTEIVSGLPNDPVNAIREDPKRRGLLFCATERMVHVSFDDGAHWQSLRLNLPATSVRDIIVKDDDLAVGTHGRGFWVLDDITPLRQLSSSLATSPVILYKPQQATRVRWGMYPDSPIPPDEPGGTNPPDGAIINYTLTAPATGEVKLEILDKSGRVIRTYSSKDKPYVKGQDNVPDYWLRPQQSLSGNTGSYRFLWDLRYDPLALPPAFGMNAVYRNTPIMPTSPWVLPGTYTARLTINGKAYTQTFDVRMDPRVKTSMVGLQQQHDLSVQMYELRKNLLSFKPANEEQKKASEKIAGQAAGVFGILDEADAAPTTQATSAVKMLVEEGKKLLGGK
jgi:photosystem II stability/assembly factor-like uncharacterized protein